MKRFIVCLIFAGITAVMFGQSDFYYSERGEKNYFKTRTDKMILRTGSAAEAKALSMDASFLSARVHTDVVTVTVDALRTNREVLMQRRGVTDAAYALESDDGILIYLKNQIYVKFKDGLVPEEVLRKVGLIESVESILLSNPWSMGYRIRLNVKLGDILRICRDLYESGLVKCAEPSSYYGNETA